MSHFLERLTYLSRRREPFARWPRRAARRRSHVGGGLPAALAARQDRALDARRELHRLVLAGRSTSRAASSPGRRSRPTIRARGPDMPNHEPRGCSRGASYSWYLYSASRIKYPLVRGRLVKAWREARKTLAPVEAWAVDRRAMPKTRELLQVHARPRRLRALDLGRSERDHRRGQRPHDQDLGTRPRGRLLADPGDVDGLLRGRRALSVACIGGTLLSFYDWYCDLPPSSPQTWGEQTDVPESADWYNSSYHHRLGLERAADAHARRAFLHRGALQRAPRVVAITPDYSEVAKFADLWLHPKQGTDAALAMAMGHVILREFFLDRQVPYFQRLLPPLHRHADAGAAAAGRRAHGVPDRYVRAERSAASAPKANSAAWKTVAFDEETGELVGAAGLHRLSLAWRGRSRRALESRGEGRRDRRRSASGAQPDRSARRASLSVAFPYFGGSRTSISQRIDQGGDVLLRNVPVAPDRAGRRRGAWSRPSSICSAPITGSTAVSAAPAPRAFDDNVPYTPAWQEPITGVPRDKAITVAREFAAQRREDQGPLDGDHRRRHEPLVPPGHELPQHHQHADDVRQRRRLGRRLGALRRAGEAPAADRLDAARLRARLGPAAAPHERHLVLLRAQRSVALREARRRRSFSRRSPTGALSRQPDRSTTSAPSAWAGCRRRRSLQSTR